MFVYKEVENPKRICAKCRREIGYDSWAVLVRDNVSNAVLRYHPDCFNSVFEGVEVCFDDEGIATLCAEKEVKKKTMKVS